MCYVLIVLQSIANIWLCLIINKKFKFYDSIFDQAKIYYNENLNKGDKK